MGESVVVIGAGVIGLASAYFLQLRGYQVTVIERTGVGRGASLGNAGWITPSLSAPLPAPGLGRYVLRSLGSTESPLFISPRLNREFVSWLWQFWRNCDKRIHQAGADAVVQLNLRTMDLFDQLSADGVNFSMWRNGLLFVFLNDRNAKSELAKLQALESGGLAVAADTFDGDQARSIEPDLSERVSAAFLLESERHVDPATLTDGLATALRERGATIHEGIEVTGFQRNGRSVTAVQTATGAIHADHILVAAGAWTGRLLRDLGLKIPLEAGKGYSFEIQKSVPLRQPLYLSDAKIGVSPLRKGRIRLAGTMELSGINLKLNGDRIDSMVKHARRFFNSWPKENLAQEWVGMRPVSADGLPIIGKPSGFDNVFIATGHNMLGVTLAPATGECLAELLATGEMPPALRPFSPERFEGVRRNRGGSWAHM